MVSRHTPQSGPSLNSSHLYKRPVTLRTVGTYTGVPYRRTECATFCKQFSTLLPWSSQKIKFAQVKYEVSSFSENKSKKEKRNLPTYQHNRTLVIRVSKMKFKDNSYFLRRLLRCYLNFLQLHEPYVSLDTRNVRMLAN